MMWRLKDLPVYSSAPTTVEASQFNLIRRAVMKSTEPLRIPLKNSSHIDLIIDDDSWVCVDNTNNDMPILSWVEFKTQNRDALHTPIECTKNYYHFGSASIAGNALEEAVEHLAQHFSIAPVCDIKSLTKQKKIWKTNTEAELSCV